MILPKQFAFLARAALALLLWLAMATAHAQIYSWPSDLTKSPFNCSVVSSGVYSCGAMDFSKDTYITISSPITVIVNGNFGASKNFIIPDGADLLLDVKGKVTFQKDMNAYMDIKSTGSMTFAKNTIMHGDLHAGDDITIAKDSLIDGDVYATDQLKVGKNSSISGSCSYTTTNYICSSTPAPVDGFSHFLIDHDGQGLTCAPSEVTVWACSAATTGGTCPTTTIGKTGTLVVKSAGGAQLATYPITIPAGQDSVEINVAYPGQTPVTFGTTDSGTTCWSGTTNSCSHAYLESGFDFDVPDHVAAKSQTVALAAIKQGEKETTCAAAYNTAKPVSFSCAYSNPGTGSTLTITTPAQTTELTCGPKSHGTAKTVTLPFNPSGIANFTLTYPNSGEVQLKASAPGLPMSGTDSFVAAPANFLVQPSTSNNYIAGDKFKLNITARNFANNPTTNYGTESTPQRPTLTFFRCQPEPGENGIFTGTVASFTSGVGESSDSTWDEVGRGDVIATDSNYLASGLAVTGATGAAATGCSGALGPFKPHHFKTELVDLAAPFNAPPTFAYSGQPFAVRVIPQNLANEITANYHGTFAKVVTLTAWSDTATSPTQNPGPGVLSSASITAASFLTPATAAGTGGEQATATGSPAYTFTYTDTPVKPTVIRIRAVDTDNVTSASATQARMPIRAGRLRMSNAFGGAARDLTIDVRTEYWTGTSWLLNTEDKYTRLPAAAIALSPRTGLQGVEVLNAIAINGGKGSFVLKKPTFDAVLMKKGAYVDFAANLGNGTSDTSCLSAHPTSGAGAAPWLRSRYGSCTGNYANWGQDPAARASFGISTLENKATIHVREDMN